MSIDLLVISYQLCYIAGNIQGLPFLFLPTWFHNYIISLYRLSLWYISKLASISIVLMFSRENAAGARPLQQLLKRCQCFVYVLTFPAFLHFILFPKLFLVKVKGYVWQKTWKDFPLGCYQHLETPQASDRKYLTTFWPWILKRLA